jgi:hypothetical protein
MPKWKQNQQKVGQRRVIDITASSSERVLLILRNKQYHSLGATSGKYEGCFCIVKRTLHSNHDGNKIHTYRFIQNIPIWK